MHQIGSNGIVERQILDITVLVSACRVGLWIPFNTCYIY